MYGTMLAVGAGGPVKLHGFVVKDGKGQRGGDGGDVGGGGDGEMLMRELRPIAVAAAGGGGGRGGGLRKSTLSCSVKRSEGVSMSPGLATRQGDIALAEYTHLTPGVKKIMRSVVRGLKAYQEPEAATEGLGGTYFFKSENGVKIAIMKPCDEEPLAPNNPKGFVGRQLGEPGLKPTVRVGEAASREVAAYLLDHEGFAKVPHTVMVRMSHPIFHQNSSDETVASPRACPSDVASSQTNEAVSTENDLDFEEEDELPLKLGSLQGFVAHECDSSEVGTSRFKKQDVHRIGILDIRLFNTDRHAGNILVRRVRRSLARLDGLEANLNEEYDLIPIDHGFALPEGLEPPYFEWQHWPQAMMPFEEEDLQYIARLNPKADSELLRRELPGIHEGSLRVMELATLLLQECAAAGLTLSEIAGIVTRPMIGIDDEPSELEKMCWKARQMIADRRMSSSVSLSGLAPGEFDGHSVMSLSGDLDGSGSPGADSAATNFPMSIDGANGSDVSKSIPIIDDALFSMDEDGGLKTPGPGSPETHRKERAYAAAPSLRVHASGEVESPYGNSSGATFKDAISNGSEHFHLSYDSDSPQHQHTSADNGAKEFRGAQSFVSGFSSTIKTRGDNSTLPRGISKTKIHCSRSDFSEVSDDPGSVVQSRAQYPPLIEPRGCSESSQILNDISKKEWDEFLKCITGCIREGIRAGIWREQMSGRGAVKMSCPGF